MAPFRETQSLLNTNTNCNYAYGNRIRKEYLKTYNWNIISLALLSGLISCIVWLTVFQSTSVPLLASPSPSEILLKLSSPEITNSLSNTLSSSKSSKTTEPSISSIGNTTVYHHTFIVTEGILCSDNFVQKGFLINGHSPGPEIRIKEHSILIVQVTNNLKVDLTFHFHGIHQRKSFLSDGVPMVTQMPIPPGGSFTHEIDTWPQIGTFFYHAHTAMDIVWLYGALIIEDDPRYENFPEEYQYDEDRVFIMNGIYHESLEKLLDRIAGPVHSYPAVTSSISINGKSFGLWEGENAGNYLEGDYVHNENETGYYVTSVEKGKVYRLRFINAASDSLLSCNLTSHMMTVIETDGVYMEPVKSDHLVLTPGQRYSVIVKMDQEIGNYRLLCYQMESTGPLNGVAVIHYEGADLPSKEMLNEDRPGAVALELDPWIIEELGPNISINQTDYYAVPRFVDREIVIDVFEVVVGQQHLYLLNGHYFEEPSIPYFMQLKQGINISNAPQVFEIIEGESIQFVFQNQRTGDFCFSHPWHIHGHSFHVVGQGSDRYDPLQDGKRIEEDIKSGNKKFQFRDTLTVYANQTLGEKTDGAFCGWAAVRFWAKNPGVWLAHCHVTPHMIMGKKFVIWEHPQDDPYLSKLMNAKKRV